MTSELLGVFNIGVVASTSLRVFDGIEFDGDDSDTDSSLELCVDGIGFNGGNWDTDSSSELCIDGIGFNGGNSDTDLLSELCGSIK